MSLSYAVILGSVRETRQGIKAARFVMNTVSARGHKATLVDPAESQLPPLGKMYKEYAGGEAPAEMIWLAELFRAVDGFIIVSGEYNHAPPPPLMNLLDHFLEEYYFRPSGIVCYSLGGFGGVRAAMQLRMSLAEMGMASIPSMYPIPRIGQAFDDAGTPLDEAAHGRIKRFLDELDWYAEALRDRRVKGLPR